MYVCAFIFFASENCCSIQNPPTSGSPSLAPWSAQKLLRSGRTP